MDLWHFTLLLDRGNLGHPTKKKECFAPIVVPCITTATTTIAAMALHTPLKGGRRYTIFPDSTAAINRARPDTIGPGQQWDRAAIEVYSCLMSRENEVTILWVPAHSGVDGNEEADVRIITGEIDSLSRSGYIYLFAHDLSWRPWISLSVLLVWALFFFGCYDRLSLSGLKLQSIKMSCFGARSWGGGCGS